MTASWSPVSLSPSPQKLPCRAANSTKSGQSLGSLAVAGRTPSLRYKAYLAGLVFDNPSIFTGTDVRKFDSSEELFASLSDRLQKVLIGSIDRKYVRER